jgi:thiol-disulfide isomerase/thioredoxin
MVSSNNNKKNNVSMPLLGSMNKQNWSILAFFALIVLLFAIYYLSYKSNYEQSNFESFEGGEPNLIVASQETVIALFYADWCPHCVSFKPDYKKAMTKLNGKKYKGKDMRFEMVDCDKHKSLSKKYDVNGFPTVKILNSDGSSADYEGARTYEGLTGYFS